MSASLWLPMFRVRSTVVLATALVLALAVCPEAQAGPLPVQNPKIDSHAQFALADLASKGGASAREAVQLIAAVTSGRLGGVYLSNQGVPAKRAQAWGTTWWDMIPKGLNAVVVPPAPGTSGKPIVVLRHSIASKPASRNAALLDGWRTFAVLDAGVATECSGGASWIRQIVGDKHCLPPAPLPSSMTAPKSLFMSGGGVAGTFGPNYGPNPKCHRVNMSYPSCKANIGQHPDLPAIKAANVHESTADPKLSPLTSTQLLRIMQPVLLPNTSVAGKQQRQRLKTAVPWINEAFDVFGLNTPRARAHYLAHFGGETGEGPSLFRIVEVGGSKMGYAPFYGRGPVQVTHRRSYVLSLAYMHKRASMADAASAKTLAKISAKVDGLLSKGSFTSQDIEQLEALSTQHRQELRTWLSVTLTLDAIRGDEDEAGNVANGFLFSGAYWHAAMCPQRVKNMPTKTAQSHFVGSALGSACVAGGAVSKSGNDKAEKKAKIYNLAVAEFAGMPSQSGGVKPKIKPSAKNKPRRRIRLPGRR